MIVVFGSLDSFARTTNGLRMRVTPETDRAAKAVRSILQKKTHDANDTVLLGKETHKDERVG
jgi:hypothetical protein